MIAMIRITTSSSTRVKPRASQSLFVSLGSNLGSFGSVPGFGSDRRGRSGFRLYRPLFWGALGLGWEIGTVFEAVGSGRRWFVQRVSCPVQRAFQGRHR